MKSDLGERKFVVGMHIIYAHIYICSTALHRSSDRLTDPERDA